MRTAIVAVLLVLTGLAAPAPASAQDLGRVASMCADCHGDVDLGKLGALTHADSVSCLTCHHVGYTNDPAEAQARRIETCQGCHESVLPGHVGVDGDTPECTQCHTIHDPPSAAEVDVRVSASCAACHTTRHPLHAEAGNDAPECTQCHTMHTGASFHPEDGMVAYACASCHEDVHPSHAGVKEGLECTQCHSVNATSAEDASQASASWACQTCHTDLHPTHSAVAPDEAPTCTQCHAFATDPVLEEAGPLVAARCGACHQDEMDGYRFGGHGAGMGPLRNEDLPTCVTCHEAHADPASQTPYRLTATARCIGCHSQEALARKYDLPENVGASYTDDFHGATVQFQLDDPGRASPDAVMICSDCHGAHEVGWNEGRVVAEVCTRCHDESDDRLAGAWLGHNPIGPKNKALIWLVRLFYFFLIPFMLGGLFLNIVFHLIDQRRGGARVMETEGVKRLLKRFRREKLPKVETVTRFSLSDRLDHLGSMTTFILLVITGLPQTRPDLAAARAIIDFFGGIGMTRIVHRTVGVIFVILMVTHVVRAVVQAVRKRRLPIMTPIRKDFEDILQTFRHYLFGAPRPNVGKFDFSEKFEYWGLFLGGIVMSSTGIILMFPELVTQWLPGIIVAATRVMHGLEATFAVLVVILWHSYGVIFRPEVFPLDTTIFTGKMDVQRLRHEHALEYQRLFPERGAGAGHRGEDADTATKGFVADPREGLANAD